MCLDTVAFFPDSPALRISKKEEEKIRASNMQIAVALLFSFY